MNNGTTTAGPTGTGVKPTGAFATGGSGSNTTYTSMIKSTRTHTITSCAPTVTNCPVGKVTTEVITSYTTWCPGEHKPKPTTTSAYTKEPCSEVTLTFVIPKTYYCTKGQAGCTEGEEMVTSHPATIVPITPIATPTPIPGCNDCHPKQPKSSPAAPAQTVPGVVAVPVNPKPVETAKPVQTKEHVPAVPTAVPQPPAEKPSTMASVQPSGTGAPSASQPPITAGAAGLYLPGLAAVAAALVAAF